MTGRNPGYDPDVHGSGRSQRAAAGTARLDPDEVLSRAAAELPLPRSGASLARWSALRALGRDDLSLTKVVEPHHDATAILADLGEPTPEPGTLWGVWAAEPPGTGLDARAVDGGWRLSGVKPFCSGAGLVTHALVTATVDGRSALYAVDVLAAVTDGRIELAAPTWVGPGMARADTRTAVLDAVPARPVGVPGAYTDRAGFWDGAIGVAACWAGGTEGVAATLLAAARRREPGPYLLSALGAVTAAVDRGRSALERAAAEVDAASAEEQPDRARRRAESVRATVVAAAEEVLTRVGHALGPGPLALDEQHSRRVADLTVFCRQHHADRDLAALGRLVASGDERW